MPAVGAASGSLERFIDENKVRQTHGAVVLGGKKIADFQTVQKRVGEAAARIDACRLVARHAVDAAELQVRHDGKSSMAIRLLSRRTQSFIANEAKTATDLIFDAAGGRCLQHSHPLQRAWRDVAAINHHISLNFDAVRMSAFGTKRTSRRAQSMSAFGGKADIDRNRLAEGLHPIVATR
jgi:alkylation response protein AidB-like acyl-CoA dehydrogenase